MAPHNDVNNFIRVRLIKGGSSSTKRDEAIDAHDEIVHSIIEYRKGLWME
jgi:hypothetical protein